MAKQVQRRRGTTAEHAVFTGAAGEVTVDTDRNQLIVHDGATPGGFPQLRQADIDTDGSFAADSDEVVPSQKAAKAYADTKIAKTILTTQGDLLTMDSGSPPSPTRLPIGNAGDYLSSDGAGLVWAAGPAIISVRTIFNVNLASISTELNVGDSVNGVTLANGDLVLLNGQTAPAENGIYVAGASPARHSDYQDWAAFVGLAVVVREGDRGAPGLWLSTAAAGGTLDTDSLSFVTGQKTPTRSVYSAGGTYTWERPVGCTRIKVTGVGAGGAGGGAASTGGSTRSAGCGGGGAESFEVWIDVTDLEEAEVIVGDTNPGTSGAVGSDGDDSSFDGIVAAGGPGGDFQAATSGNFIMDGTLGGEGGTDNGYSNVLRFAGNPGEGSQYISALSSGLGGGSRFGGGARARSSSVNGTTGQGPGGGGGGAANGTSQSARPGGTGHAGLVIVEEFYNFG